MRFRDAMAPRLSRRAWIVLALFPLLPLVALWPRIPAQAEPDDGALKISLDGEILTLEARSVPLDRLLDGLAAASDFAVAVKCGAAGCPTIRGRLRGTLGEVLDQILHGHGYSRTFGPASATDQRPKLWRLVVLTASSDRSGRPEALATLDSNESAMFADLMRWASRESRNPFPAKPARGEGPAHLWLSEPGAPLFHQAPLSEFRVTSGFGPRRDPLSGQDAWHQGVDLAAPADTKVLNAAPGTVLSAGRHGGFGIMVEVDHGGGVATRYAHLSEALVRPGQRLAGGDPLGVIGASGRTTGQHLHLEVRIGDRPVDPMQFLASGRRLAWLDRKFPSIQP